MQKIVHAHGGNGRDLCAEIDDTREVLAEVRDNVTALRFRFDDESRKWADRDGELTKAILELTAVIGSPPDPSTGAPGSGMRGQLAAAVNASIRSERPSILDREESEITAVQDRDTLIARARIAEHARTKDRIAIRRATIRAWTGLAVGVIGAIAAAAATLIPILR